MRTFNVDGIWNAISLKPGFIVQTIFNFDMAMDVSQLILNELIHRLVSITNFNYESQLLWKTMVTWQRSEFNININIKSSVPDENNKTCAIW